MSGFISRKIQTIQTLGEKLAKHRIEKGFAVEKAARAINVNVKYLKNIEANKYKALPADVYTYNILKSYAELLDLNPTTVIDIYQNEKKLFFKTRKKTEINKITRLGRYLNIFLNPRTVKYFFISLILIAILSYIGLEVNSIISPPELFVESPENNLVTLDNRIEIKGKTDKEVNLMVNNRPLLSDKNGNFSLTLDLQTGLNIIKISAQKKHSREQVVYRQVIVSAQENN